ncbi:DNA (cytosine-5)-methyltransferase CMT3-like [Chenopodium quinoa]|uniref:DNA (cytosine-5)-methyltransferase CMT3-like n=1 Tax=Chenopodium quinoa TaxID=63459 RepID=UPI000B7764CF|nr:DNA (cytosine-5)-methyltransferase CMT3-like [Chenopodium quinoa]
MPKRKSAKKKPASSPSSASACSKKQKVEVVEKVEEVVNNVKTESSEASIPVDEEVEAGVEEMVESPTNSGRKNSRKLVKNEELDCRFLGDPVPADEAKLRWPHRYSAKVEQGAKKSKTSDDDDDELIRAKCHYLKAEVDGFKIFELNDNAHVQSEDGKPPYICKILEMFEGVDGLPYFRAQWYYRSVDTVMKGSITLREAKRVFASEIMDDNPLDCLLEKINIVRVTPNLDVDSKLSAIPECDYYYDMKYLLPYSTYIIPPAETASPGSESQSTISSDMEVNGAVGDAKSDSDEPTQGNESRNSEITVLDLYCGCGAMSTGLCLGANLHGSNLVTRWAVDVNQFACQSLALNHPETNVRNESVGDFLTLLKEWPKICASFGLIQSETTHKIIDSMVEEDDDNAEDDANEDDNLDDEEVFEVEKVLGICYGDPKDCDKPGLYFKVRWKGYGEKDDTWEPLEGLSNCREKIGDFVKKGYTEKLLPFPGDVDVVCGGPPCQGISGFNRFRNAENPLADPKNEQLVVYMDVVNYLKPKYALMENVVDLVKFSKGFLGRYALGRLVDMNYQARMGMMAAGAYGLPQFRMRVFIWGAQPSEKLPQYPLPTHDLVLRGVIPTEFEINTVAYNEGHTVQLENKLFLGDAISDMPEVTNSESRDEIPYSCSPKTEFQRFIRMTKDAMLGSRDGSEFISKLYDHRPLNLNVDDYQRVCRIPKKKGANFRDLPGVRVRSDNKVEWDPDVEREYLPSKKPLVPDYAMTFVGGTSSKPFARLWWDETVPTVVTRAEPHNQAVLHPVQDRVLTIRENARLQGFPDYYQLKGGVKDRYIQVGNAVAVPVARALGYSLALAMASEGSLDGPVMTLPPKFPNIHDRAASPIVEDNS